MRKTCRVFLCDKLVDDLTRFYEPKLLPDHFLEIGHIGLEKMAFIREVLDLRIDLQDLLVQVILLRLQFPVARNRRQIDPAQDQNDRERDR